MEGVGGGGVSSEQGGEVWGGGGVVSEQGGEVWGGGVVWCGMVRVGGGGGWCEFIIRIY